MPLSDDQIKRPRKRVIVTERGAEPCQRCLVKWARVRVLGELLCNTCGNKVRGKVEANDE
jgi:hypothetical protein